MTEIQKKRDYVVCADGFTMSVQASENHYCSPRADGAEVIYGRVEIGFPSEHEPEFDEYVEQLEALFGTPKAAVAPPPTNPPAPAPAGAPAPQADGPPLCPVHQVAMQPSKQSHSTWYCNKRDDTTSNGWCGQSI